MVELDQFKAILNSYAKPLVEVRDSLDLANKEKRIEELERKMEEPDFWDNPERSQEMMKELKSLKDDKEIYENLESQRDDMETLIEMGYEEDDASVIPEIQEILDQFEADFENIRMKTLLSGEYDKKDAIIKLNAGAGGTESCDWAGMLYRMYTRWAEKKGFTLEVLDYLDGDEAGIKSVTFEVHGENAYGYLKSEKGVHRLVRISPFNAAERDRLRSYPAMLCRILMKIWMWISRKMICVSIRIDPAVPVVSILTRPLLPSVLHIFQPESWYSVRMNVLSFRIKTRLCRC